MPGRRFARGRSRLWILRGVFSSSGGEEAVELELRGHDLERFRDRAPAPAPDREPELVEYLATGPFL